MIRRSFLAGCLFAAGLASSACDMQAPIDPGNRNFINFETIPTRAVALSPDGSRLFVNNVPDGRLEIFSVTSTGLTPESSVQVGMDPIALAVRNESEVWVVNHLSDSVSIVDVGASPPRVKRTLLVGDEPRDVVFAGTGGTRAFITAARRGQNHPDNTVEETQVPGIGRADVWIFDANDLGSSLGGTPIEILTLFSDKPGALAATPDGSKVFVSVFTSGNGTTTISDVAVCGPNGASRAQQFSNQDDGPCMLINGGRSPGGVPAPNVNQADGARNPKVALIATNDKATGAWNDVLGRDFRDAVPFVFPDNDVFTIDANANPPAQSGVFNSVGTLNFNLVVHPTNGNAYLATIDAVNQNRFVSLPGMGLGPNPDGLGGAPIQADPITGRTLRGHLYESRIAVLRPDGSFVTRHLNKHIDYEAFPTPPGTLERSVANPQGVIFSADGETLFVAALGSNKIVPFDRTALENDTFQPDASTHIQLSGNGGPSDMVLDPSDPNRMFVYKRFDNAVSIVDIAAQSEVASIPLFNPEPAEVQVGRKFFYDATLTSDNGEANCNVCHPAADKDDLAWNLGTPFLGLAANPNDFTAPGGGGGGQFLAQFGSIIFGVSPTIEFNPIKGPMTVLTLRGIKDSGPMFWRGDQTNATDPTDERANFQNFALVFDALNGKTGGISDADFQNFTNWALTLVPPPNPHQPLDGSWTTDQEAGRNIFMGGEGITDVIFTCVDCHSLDRGQGFFGTAGRDSIEGETQFFKVTQLRTVYDKVGMFGHTFGDNGTDRTLGGPRVDVGPQVRATGTLHDGTAAGAEEFLTADVFQLDARQLKQVVDFSYAFPSNVAPVVGQQITLGADSGPDVIARLDLFQQSAADAFVMPGPVQTTECDLVASGVVDGAQRGYLFQPASNNFMDDTGSTLSVAALRSQAQVPGQQVTFTCVYPGGGTRIALDRDLDGTLNGADGANNAPAPTPAPGGNAGGGGAPAPAPAPAPADPLGDLFDAIFGGLGALFGG